VHNLQAEICTECHCKTSLQKAAVALAKTILADEKYDNRHDCGNGELGYVLVVAAFDETLLDGTAVVKYKPILHEERNHEDSNDN
jgi:hypothetical protein